MPRVVAETDERGDAGVRSGLDFGSIVLPQSSSLMRAPNFHSFVYLDRAEEAAGL